MSAPDDGPPLPSDVASTSRTAAGDDVSTPGTEALPVHDVERLLADGVAEPLLAGYRPVPIRYRQRWWHLPEGLDDYRPAPAAAAAVFDARRTRLRAAAEAAARRPGTREPRW